jgi:hypothetical protein
VVENTIIKVFFCESYHFLITFAKLHFTNARNRSDTTNPLG